MARLKTLKLPKGVEIDEVSNDNLFTHPSAGSVPTTLAVKDYLHDEIDKHDQEFMPDGLYRNAIINGNFDIWQRGTRFTGCNIYTADRWCLQTHPGYSHTIERIIEDGNTYLRATVDQVSPYYNVGTMVEDGRNLFRGQQLSLRIRCRASGNYTLRAYIASASNYAVTSEPILDQAFTVTTVFKEYTFTTNRISNTFDGTYKNLRVSIYLFEGAANVPVGGYIDIDYITMNIGDKPLPFSPRPYAEELALCQRYFERITGGGVAYKGYCAGYIASTTTAGAHLPFMVVKRSVPTISFSGQNHFQVRAPAGAFTGSGISAQNPNIDGVDLTLTISGAVAGEACIIRDGNSGNSYIDIDAEL